MQLLNGGIDLFYVDESARHPLFAATAVRVPFLRRVNDEWRFVWSDYHSQAEAWRRGLSKRHRVLFRKELHTYEIVKHQGLYHKSRRNLTPEEAQDFMQDALGTLTFLPPASVITAYAGDTSEFAGMKGMGACMIGLFQRIRLQCLGDNVNGMVFFDEGHDEYISYYRRSQKWLPTGSRLGGWPGAGYSNNLPLSMFPKDANFKKSKLSYFLQIADMIVYTARLKIEKERNVLSAKRVRRGHGDFYGCIPKELINLRATRKRNDGIVPI